MTKDGEVFEKVMLENRCFKIVCVSIAFLCHLSGDYSKKNKPFCLEEVKKNALKT